MIKFKHTSVLLEETIESLNIKENGVYIDGTIGGAGHSSKILKKLSKKGLLIGLDQDINAINKSQEVLSDISDRYKLFNTNYKNFEQILENLRIDKVDGILLDLGVSSYQFDQGERGFSYKYDARLDMRMDQSSNLTAWDIVNGYTKEEISRLLKEYSEEKWASRIAEFIVQKRLNSPINTTFELVEVIKDAIPIAARRKKGHPAKKTFQALRIETNNELGVLRNTLGRMIERLAVGGRISIISFHSLEDRIVKETFKYYYLDCICPPEIPFCSCDKKRSIEILTRKPILPSSKELALNNRSHSAKLRVAEKI